MKDVFEVIKEKRVVLAAHRGACGGNIPCNSIAAFKAALYAGADIIELDSQLFRRGEDVLAGLSPKAFVGEPTRRSRCMNTLRLKRLCRTV